MSAAVWTDFGGVLTPPISVTLERFCAPLGVQPATFYAAMRTLGDRYGTDPMGVLDTPVLTEDEWVAEMTEVLAAEHGAQVDLSGFADRWFADRETNVDWLEHLKQLRSGGVFVGMLSNMVPSWDRHWREMVQPDAAFDDVLLSFQCGHRKPDRAMFDLAADRCARPPGECVLIDDLPANCAGAEAAGWRAIRFTDAADAAARLDELLAELPALPDGPPGQPPGGLPASLQNEDDASLPADAPLAERLADPSTIGSRR